MPVPTIQLTGDATVGVTVSRHHFATVAALPQTVKLGYKPSKTRPQAPALQKYLKHSLSAMPLPEKVDYYSGASASIARVYRNNVLGCCVISGKGHLLGVWSTGDKDSGPVVLATDAEIDQQYSSVCGPGDNGCYIPDVLDYMKSKGFQAGGNRYKIKGYASVDWRSKDLVKATIAIFGGCTIGFNLPSAWTNEAVWDVTNTRIVGGHDVTPCGYGVGIEMDPDGGGPKRFAPDADYLGFGLQRFSLGDYHESRRAASAQRIGEVMAATADGVIISSWGRLYLITWPAFNSSKYITEMYALVPETLWTGLDKKTPLGLDLSAMMADMDTLGGGNLPPLPDPTPVGPPDPPPVVPPVVPPSPPVVPPPPPAPVHHETLDISISGKMPTGMFGTMTTVTMTGTASPKSSPFAPHETHGAGLAASAIPWLTVITYVARCIPVVFADVQAGKSMQEILADVLAVLAPSLAQEHRASLAANIEEVVATRTREEWLAIAQAVIAYIVSLFHLQMPK